jgi:hypothetical protein
MYRIELSPGEETVFRSIEELAVAIKRGLVTPRARIFHNASSKWLPIQYHPHYQTAVSLELTQAALVNGPKVKPLSSLSLEPPAQTEPSAFAFVPLPEQSIQPAPAPSQKPRVQPSKSKRSRRPTQPRRQLRIALVGALLVGGAQWVLSAPLFSGAEVPALLHAQRHLISAPTEAIRRAGSPNSAAMVPVLPNSQAATAPVNLEQLTEPASGPTAPSFGGTGSTAESATADSTQPGDSAGHRAARVMPQSGAAENPPGKR